MSTYSKLTKNPKTGEFEYATWMDDYFGRHHYGVKFPDGSILDPEKVYLATIDMPNNTKKEECDCVCHKSNVLCPKGMECNVFCNSAPKDKNKDDRTALERGIDNMAGLSDQEYLKNKEEVTYMQICTCGQKCTIHDEQPETVITTASSPQSPLSVDLIHCSVHPTSEPFNKFNGRCKWCYSNMHPEYSSPSSNEDWEIEFDKMFPLAWFATENYTGEANEYEFNQWTRQQTQMAEMRRDVFVRFIRTTRLEAQRSLAEEILDLQREEPLMVEGGVALDKIISVDNLKIVLSSRGLLPKITE